MDTITDDHQEQAEISKHEHLCLVGKINKMELEIREVLAMSEIFETDQDGNPPFTSAMQQRLNKALEF